MTGSAITWVELTDEDDNPYWQGVSPYTDGDAPMLWRIRMALAGGKIVYESDHTPELRSCTPPVWYTLVNAQSDCQFAHDEIIRKELGGNPHAVKPPVPDLEWEWSWNGTFLRMSKCRQYTIVSDGGTYYSYRWAHVLTHDASECMALDEAIKKANEHHKSLMAVK